MVYVARQGFFLRDLEGERISFYSLFVEKMTSPVLLWLQEVVLKLCLHLLKLLLGSIASDGSESSSRDGYLCVLGFGVCGAKSNEHGPLFIALLVLAHRGCGVLHFLSINQTQTWLRSEDFGKGEIPGFIMTQIRLPWRGWFP
jgi:hypothetical protein